MKTKIIYGFSLIVTLFIINNYYGLLERSKVQVDDIVITVPVGTTYSSTYSEDNNSFTSLHNASAGDNTSYKMKEGQLLTLRFSNRFLFEDTVITFIYQVDIKNKDIERNCTEKKIVPYKDKYETGLLLYKKHLLFNIIADTKNDINYYQKQICEK